RANLNPGAGTRPRVEFQPDPRPLRGRGLHAGRPDSACHNSAERRGEPLRQLAKARSRGEACFFPASVCPVHVRRTAYQLAEYIELVVLFFVHGAALGMWFVPLSTVLDGHGLHAIKPYAFAASAVAAFVSPLFFGAMADRHASPVVVLR